MQPSSVQREAARRLAVLRIEECGFLLRCRHSQQQLQACCSWIVVRAEIL